LRAKVLTFLTDHPGQSYTLGEIARALGGRSTGAVGNALATLARTGQVTRAGVRPCRFAATRGPHGHPVITGGTPAPTSAPRPAYPASVPQVWSCGPMGSAITRARWPTTPTSALRALRAAGMPALLYGPPGTGKTPSLRPPSPTWSPWPAMATPRWPTSDVIFGRAKRWLADQQRCVADGVLDAA